MLHESLEDVILDELGDYLDIQSILLTSASAFILLKLLAIGFIAAVSCEVAELLP